MTRRLAALAALLAPPAPRRSRPVPKPPTPSASTPCLRPSTRDNPTLAAARLDARALAQRGVQVGALPDPTASVMVAPYPILTARGTQRSQWRVEQRIPWPGTLSLRRDVADVGGRGGS